MNIGKIILFHRRKAGLSRIELARLAGVGKTIVYDLEHGRLSIGFSKLLSLCQVLNIQPQFHSPFMEEFEKEALASYPGTPPRFWERFVDDTIVALKKAEKQAFFPTYK